MLELLTRYAQSHNLVAEPGFNPKTVKWCVHVNRSGKPFVLALGNPEEKGNRGLTFPRCPELSQPELKRGGAGCRHFLVDSADVVALHHKSPDAKLKAKHAYFVDLLDQASTVMPELAAIVGCLRTADSLAEIQDQLTNAKAKPGDIVTFSLEGLAPVHPVESTEWHDWWRHFRQGLAATPKKGKGSGPGAMRCLASGELVTPVLTHPKIRGLAGVGGLAQGDVLASFKQDSFRSYGLTQSANAALSEEKAAEYRAALNDLIANTGQTLAGARVVHWFKKQIPPEDDPLNFLNHPSSDGTDKATELSAQDRARRLLKSIRSGKRKDLQGNYYYALTLSGASGRVMVRDYMDGQFEELVQAIDSWFSDLSIVHRSGSGLALSPKFLAVMGCLVRDLDDLPAPMVATGWRVAVRGAAIPAQFLAMAQHRVRSAILKDEPFNHARMGLLKAFHIRQGDQEMKPHLNEDHPQDAYQCGRLMAVLSEVQHKALGDVGAGVVQRYYAAASATPALVLGRLIRNSQYHLEKISSRNLRKEKQGKIADIMSRIGDIPQTLTLSEQSLFALGYYQQFADLAPGATSKNPVSTIQPSITEETSDV